ncbi:MAG: helix-hairpin-helix domain-containing protein [Acidobacteria bacterium]|jgi:competence protein ComEA|nr:helix-hairpin-helix domain-containing protein [Acidobacteriota bacterium]
MTSTLTRLALVLSLALGPLAVSGAAQEAAAKSAATPAVVNLNAATPEQLETLPGIGPRAAQRIVEYRTKNGGFKKVEDLMKIQGIGERSFLRLRPLVTVGSSKGDAKAQQ